MPGVGVGTTAVLLVTVGDGTNFLTAAHLASYAGLAPTTKSPSTSIHSEPDFLVRVIRMPGQERADEARPASRAGRDAARL